MKYIALIAVLFVSGDLLVRILSDDGLNPLQFFVSFFVSFAGIVIILKLLILPSFVKDWSAPKAKTSDDTAEKTD